MRTQAQSYVQCLNGSYCNPSWALEDESKWGPYDELEVGLAIRDPACNNYQPIANLVIQGSGYFWVGV